MGSPPTPATDRERTVAQSHGFQRLRVKDVVDETADARSFVLDVPPDLSEAFRYRAGQFCTFRVSIDGDDQLRSYSMSSAPETDSELTVTVKRVPGGLVSNWLVDRVVAGDALELTRPAGVFCLEDSPAPVVAFCGGSGVTPVISIAKAALAASDRVVRILYANRSRDSVIFGEELAELQGHYGARLELRLHFDSESGYVDPEVIREMAGANPAAAFYICGPEPFMALVETSLIACGVSPERVFIERFGTAPLPDVRAEGAAPPDTAVPGTVTVIMKGRRTAVPYKRGDTVLETARRARLNPPFSCESGNCATCMGIIRDGCVTMRANNALTPEEVAEGWVLTCQALPASSNLTVEYEAF